MSSPCRVKAKDLGSCFWKRWAAALHLREKPPEPPPRVVSDGRKVLLDSYTAGDEPWMLATNLPGVPVVVDKNRVKAGRHAIDVFASDVLLLDDGMQYLKLKHRLDIGYNTHNALTAQLVLPAERYPTPQKITAFYRDLTERLRASRGIDGAAVGTGRPMRDRVTDVSTQDFSMRVVAFLRIESGGHQRHAMLGGIGS